MRIARVLSGGQIHYGQWLSDSEALAIEGDILGDYRVTQQRLHVDKLLAPVVPTDILCIGLNYRQHAAETGAALPQHPVLFMKAGGALNNPGDPIRVPAMTSEVDYECELAVVMRKDARRISRARALDYVLGYTCANDVSARDWQKAPARSGGQWCRAKGFATFCPLGPVLVTRDEIANPNVLRIRTFLNGNCMQDSSTADMIFDVPTLIERLSASMTLRAGAVILTGTPQGVGMARKPPVYMRPGDKVAIEIEGIGRLENRIEADA
jgi:2-keto-4-pentenoate hydratase/2-oxohepta-3-ene-1,7-dioic acid hydratase in catechol pathway